MADESALAIGSDPFDDVRHGCLAHDRVVRMLAFITRTRRMGVSHKSRSSPRVIAALKSVGLNWSVLLPAIYPYAVEWPEIRMHRVGWLLYSGVSVI